MSRRIVYKGLNEGGISPSQKFRYPLPKGDEPGEWVEIAERPIAGSRGFHGWVTNSSSAEFTYEMECEDWVCGSNGLIAARRARLLRLVSDNRIIPPEPVEEGLRLCTKCGRPHTSHYVIKGFAPNWADLHDGHVYFSESWETYARRLKGELDELKALA